MTICEMPGPAPGPAPAGTPATPISPGVAGATPPTKPSGGRRTITCRSCKKHKRHHGHHLCSACCQRWNRAGRPDQVPPPRTRGNAGPVKTGRIEDYIDLTTEFGLTDAEAAERLGVSTRTIKRYKAELRQAATP